MGDRTSCTLTLSGVLDAQDIPTLVDALQEMGPDDPNEIGDMLRDEDAHFTFEEMNYGNIYGSVKEVLIALSLSYEWSWESGGEYGAGTEIYDADTGESASLSLAGGDVVVSIDRVDDANYIKSVKHWSAIRDAGRTFTVVSSNHEMITAIAEGKVPEGYLEKVENFRANL